MNTAAIRVLLVDDSAVVRQVLTGLLDSDPEIRVIGAAADPIFARERMAKEWPDVIVLDVEMPRMDGLTFLRQIMAERPTPVVICSTLTEKGTQTSMQALSAGAIAVIAKPKLNVKNYLQDASSEIVSAVKAAAQARMGRINRAPLTATVPVAAAIPQAPLSASALARTTEQVVAIGTSTGGTQALEVVLSALPSVCAGIIIVQHMPEKFTAAFASRLDSLCQIEVSEAQNGDRVRAGRALIAPGGRHMVLRRSGAQYYVEVLDGPLVNRHRPSVDVMFRSVARTAGGNALGIIMTGMGDDGAQGIAEMRQTGALTLAQDEASCVVYGMPKEAVKRGGIVRSVSLDAIAAEIVQYGASGEMGHGR